MGYSFVIASLPWLEFGAKPDVTSTEFFALCKMNLSSSDLSHIEVLRRWIDLYNIYRMIQNEEFYDKRGNFVRATLRENLEDQEGLPSYVFDFLEAYDREEEKKRRFPQLIANYFAVEKSKAGEPLKEFLRFENEWRILLAGYRAKKAETDLGDILKYENENDPIVQVALAQKDAPGPFIFPFEYEDLEKHLKDAGPNPTKQMRALAKYRFDFYAEMEYDFPFTLRRVMAYLMQLFQLEEMFALDEVEGKKELQKLMENDHGS